MSEFFLGPFIVAFGTTTSVLLLFFSAVRWSRWLQSRKKLWFRFGGVAILFGFLSSLLLDGRVVMTPPLWGFALGTVILFGFSIWDDLFDLSWRAQIFFQIVLGLLLFIFEVRILFVTNPFGGVWSFVPESSLLPVFVIGLGWLLLVMNALNWLDGSDGLCGGVSFIALITIFFSHHEARCESASLRHHCGQRGRSHIRLFSVQSSSCAYFCWNKRIDVSRLSSRFPLYGSRNQDRHGAFGSHAPGSRFSSRDYGAFRFWYIDF